jgi:hypothetical protein
LSSRATEPLALIHSDVCSPFPIRIPHGKLYFIVFLDDCTNTLDAPLLAAKSQSLEAFKITYHRWEWKMERKLKAFQSDNAGEFISEEFNAYLVEHGIERQKSAPYSHQQNRKAERTIETIEGRVLAMMAATDAPPSLWGEAVLTVSYLWNRMLSRTLPPSVTPFELIHKRKPDLSHLRVWGSRCFAQVPLELQTKLGPKSRECVFLGYPEGVKGYRARDIHSSTFFNSTDVIFDENKPLDEDDGDEVISVISPAARDSLDAPDVPSSPQVIATAPDCLPPRVRATCTRKLTDKGAGVKAAMDSAWAF